MTLEEAKVELEKFVKLKTSMRPAFVQPLLDAVEVVRCKDCAYWGTKLVYANEEQADCLNFNIVTPCEFFCKWGERREDERTVAYYSDNKLIETVVIDGRNDDGKTD